MIATSQISRMAAIKNNQDISFSITDDTLRIMPDNFGLVWAFNQLPRNSPSVNSNQIAIFESVWALDTPYPARFRVPAFSPANPCPA